MLRKIYQRFSIYSNQHTKAKEIINGKEVHYDHNVQKYPVSIQAFLQKRWHKKEEIKGKMYIIEQIEEIEDLLQTQQLYPLNRLLDESRLKRMYENNEITTSYILSITMEEHFKSMMDQYISKILINGAMPPITLYDKYMAIKNQIINLYKIFFQGDPLTDLEKEIEFRYLVLKQNKFLQYQASQKPSQKCIWTFSEQRRVEMMKNWRARDIDMYDDFRPIYEDIKLANKLKQFEIIQQIDQLTLMKRIFFHIFEKPRYQRTKKSLTLIAEHLFNRTMLFTNSIEFLKILEIPPDFHIELSIINIHIWLLTDRLKSINNLFAKHLQKLLTKAVNDYIQQQVAKIHLRKKNELVRDIEAYMKSGRDHLEYHFNRNPETVKNNYFKLDALIWSILFFEKVPRYSNQVYLMAEYIKTNYDFLQQQNYEKFETCNIEFDVFRIGFDYKEKLLKVNPPLSEEEFAEEFLSDKKKKKYYYASDEIKLDLEPKQQSLVSRRLDILNQNLMYMGKKYYNLDTFDHFSNHEEQIKIKKQQEKYLWNKDINEDIDAQELRKIIMQKNKDLK